jgi:hypothetical protein
MFMIVSAVLSVALIVVFIRLRKSEPPHSEWKTFPSGVGSHQTKIGPPWMQISIWSTNHGVVNRRYRLRLLRFQVSFEMIP